MEIDFEVRDLHRCSGQCGMGGAHERLSDQGVLLRLQRPKYVQKGAPISCFGDREFNIVDGEIVEVKPQERLVTTFQAHWDEKVSKDKPSRVAWELTPRGESSKVTLVGDRFDSEMATSFGQKTRRGQSPTEQSRFLFLVNVSASVAFNELVVEPLYDLGPIEELCKSWSFSRS
jgi:hypothetical protein